MSTYKRKPHLPLDDFQDDIDLPPLDTEERLELDSDTLADFLDSDLDKGSDESMSETNEMNPLDLLLDFEGTSIANGDDDEEMETDFDIDIDIEEESSWVASDREEKEPEPSDWFIYSDDAHGRTADDGAEGPSQKEVIEIDERCFAPLDDEAEYDDEDIVETMRRLGITDRQLLGITDERADKAVIGFADISYLGPEDGDVVQAAFMGSLPMAVGDGIYVLGADGMLHAVAGEKHDDLNATSVSYHQGALFIGTRRQGACLTLDRGETLRPINGWYDEGLGLKNLFADISTSFTILGQSLTDGEHRLCGITGEGQLYYSMDSGASWRGPVWKGRCLALAPVQGTNGILSVFESSLGKLALVTSEDMISWRVMDSPAPLLARLTEGPVTIAACEGSIFIGIAGPRGGLFRSRNFAATFDMVDRLSDVSALTLDPEAPEWMAVAVSDRVRGVSEIRLSGDSGENWRTVWEVEMRSNPARGSAPATERVTGLCARGAAGQHQLLVTTGHGVYLVTVPRGGFAH